MFETEDFDLDEDFLKDIGDKEEEYYSQRCEPEIRNEPPAKRKKVESVDSDMVDDITFDDEPDFAKNSIESSSASPQTQSNQREPKSADLSSRRKKMLEIFNIGAASFPRASQNSPNPPSPSENLEKSRKTLALEILRKNSSSIQQKPKNSTSPRSDKQKLSFEPEKNFQTTNNEQRENQRRIEREIFKKPAEKFANSYEKNSPKNFSKQHKIPVQRMTIVRKFPGPAGILPDDPDSNLDHANFLNNFDIREIVETSKDSKISDYCSQNTERLFTSGAWLTMLDDLPSNFLKGHEIATIKKPVRDLRENSRASFVAGVVQKIDNNLENPRLILKDMTDSIEATMHRDIPLAHPNVIEPGVVVLLRGAGLLGFRGSQKCPGTQYHLMIAPRNVLAVYSEKKRLIASPWMETLRKSSSSSAWTNEIIENPRKSAKIRDNDEKILSEKNEISTTICETRINELDSDEDDVAFACFDLDDIEDSQIVANFSTTKISTNFGIEKNSAITEIRENEFFNVEKSKVDDGKKTMEIVSRNLTSNEEFGRSEMKDEEFLNDVDAEMGPTKITEIKSRLWKFRNDDFAPKEAETTENLSSNGEDKRKSLENNRKSDETIAKTVGDDLLASDNDTDDEILSQLDVESIMTSYNARS